MDLRAFTEELIGITKAARVITFEKALADAAVEGAKRAKPGSAVGDKTRRMVEWLRERVGSAPVVERAKGPQVFTPEQMAETHPINVRSAIEALGKLVGKE